MRKVEKWFADDETEFETEAECVEYEASLPTLRLINDLEKRIAEDPDFAERIERLGARIAKERRERGELKRARKGEGAGSASTSDAMS